jgi:molecular chaperone IbpA
MTIEQILRNDPFFVGFERIADRVSTATKLASVQKYPPYNIIRTDDNSYMLELAVAGLSEEDIEIELHDGVLIIKNTNVIVDDKETNYIFKGIANRNFERKFTLADTIQVNEVTLDQGILRVYLTNVIPEEKKPKKIPISKSSEKQLLTE